MARSEPDDQRVKSTLSRLLQFAQPVIKSGDESDRRGVGSCFSKIFEFGVAKLLFCRDLPLGKFDAQTFRSKQKGQLASAKTQYVVTGLNPAATQPCDFELEVFHGQADAGKELLEAKTA